MAYPDTALRADTRDPDFGGAPAAEFGGKAWSWVNSVLRFLGAAYLDYLRVPYATVVATVQGAAVAGDVAIVAPGLATSLSGYYVTQYADGTAPKFFYGIFLEPVGTGQRARVAVAGIVPPGVTGLGLQSVVADVGINPATGRCRVAEVGDTVIGVVDLRGNVHLQAAGVAL